MARISGINIPLNKRVEVGLTTIFGVGRSTAQQVLAKTGSIAGVNTLSGYVTRRDGKTLLVSIQANHHTLGGRAMISAIDSLVVAVGK